MGAKDRRIYLYTHNSNTPNTREQHVANYKANNIIWYMYRRWVVPMPNKSSARHTTTTVAGYELGLRELWICDTVVVGDNYCWLVLTVLLHVMVQFWMRSYLLVCWGRNVFDKEFWIKLRKELTRLWVIVINHFFNSVITTQLPFFCLHCTLHCMDLTDST